MNSEAAKDAKKQLVEWMIANRERRLGPNNEL